MGAHRRVSESTCCAKARPSAIRTGLGAASWVIPGGAAVLMPKCPMCLAAYLAMLTGLGVTATAAAHLRTGLILVCAVAFGYWAWQRARRRRARA